MKTKQFFLLSGIFALFLLTALPSCDKGPQDICSNTAFSVEQFEENLTTSLDAESPMGYAYVIAQNGQVTASGSSGLARSVADGNKVMSINEIMHVASVSKTITTAAVLKLLDEKGVSVNASIAPYLPSHWVQGLGISNVTFLDLLTHKAGFYQTGSQTLGATTYDNLKSYVAAGASPTILGHYSNTYHAMFRVIIPILWGAHAPSTGLYDEETCNALYEQYLQEEVFQPIGVTARLNTNFHNPLLAYQDANDPDGKGANIDFSSVAGGFGWCLSANELAKFWAYLWYSDDIIDDGMRAYMTDDYAGLWNTEKNGTWGTYYCKLGGWDYGDDHWAKTAVLKFPEDTQVTVFVNSNTGTSVKTMIVDAYDDAHGCF